MFLILFVFLVGKVVFLTIKNKAPSSFQAQIEVTPSATTLNPFNQIRNPSNEYSISLSQIKYLSSMENSVWKPSLVLTLEGTIQTIIARD